MIYLVASAITAALCLGLASLTRTVAYCRNTHPSVLSSFRSIFSLDSIRYIVIASIFGTPLYLTIMPITVDWEALLTVLVVLAVILAVEAIGNSHDLLPSFFFGAETAGAIALSVTGLGIALFRNEGINILLNLLWFGTLANAFRLIQPLPTYSLDLAAVACGSIFAIASTNGQILVATLAISLGVSIVGFQTLSHRYNGVIGGTTGIRTLGFFVAYLAIQIDGPVAKTEGLTNALVPILISSPVLFNIIVIATTRLLSRNHQTLRGVPHILIEVGLSPPIARLIYTSLASTIGILTYVIYKSSMTVGIVLASQCLLIYLLIGMFLVRKSLRSNCSVVVKTV